MVGVNVRAFAVSLRKLYDADDDDGHDNDGANIA